MITVTGASGDLGSHIAKHLAKLGSVKKIRLTSRNKDKLSELAAQGFQTAVFDFDDKDSMRSAFADSETVLIISGVTPVDVRIKQHRAAVDAAVQAGVKHIVYTSFANPGSESLFPFAKIHGDTEAAITASGLNYTILRNPMYAENIAGALQHAAGTGTLALPGSNGKASYLLKDDLAELTARLLLSNPDGKQIHDLSGNTALTLADIAVIASKVWGKEVSAEELPQSIFGGMLEGFGMPAFFVDAIQKLQDAVGANEYAKVSTDAAKLLGRQPRDIDVFIETFTP